MTPGVVVVDSRLAIPRSELSVTASRAGGPGGQHVNKSSTRIELRWNVHESRVLAPEQRERLVAKLGDRLDSSGSLRIVASAYRSQARNRADAEERLAQLIRRALAVPKVRRKTRPGAHVALQRLESKRRVSEKKQLRRDPDPD